MSDKLSVLQNHLFPNNGAFSVFIQYMIDAGFEDIAFIMAMR
jgi:hypothetical protein